MLTVNAALCCLSETFLEDSWLNTLSSHQDCYDNISATTVILDEFVKARTQNAVNVCDGKKIKDKSKKKQKKRPIDKDIFTLNHILAMSNSNKELQEKLTPLADINNPNNKHTTISDVTSSSFLENVVEYGIARQLSSAAIQKVWELFRIKKFN